MRISDWSSDVCSSDLDRGCNIGDVWLVDGVFGLYRPGRRPTLRKLWPILFCDASWAVYFGRLVLRLVRRRHTHAGLAELCRDDVHVFPVEIGRASCRARVCNDV